MRHTIKTEFYESEFCWDDKLLSIMTIGGVQGIVSQHKSCGAEEGLSSLPRFAVHCDTRQRTGTGGGDDLMAELELTEMPGSVSNTRDVINGISRDPSS